MCVNLCVYLDLVLGRFTCFQTSLFENLLCVKRKIDTDEKIEIATVVRFKG